MRLGRILRHVLTPPWSARRRFPEELLTRIEEEIAASERQHSGELRFVVESALDLLSLARGVSPRSHALEVFAELGVWDTEHNNGVLILVCLADHDVEIVADRGIAARVEAAEWEAVCREMEAHYRGGRFAEGSIAGIRGAGALLARHFPTRGRGPNELSDRPLLG